MSIGEADMKYHFEGMQRLLNDLGSDYVLTITGQDVLLSGGTLLNSQLRGSKYIAGYLDEKLTEYYDK
jgi:hypothetical protein